MGVTLCVLAFVALTSGSPVLAAWLGATAFLVAGSFALALLAVWLKPGDFPTVLYASFVASYAFFVLLTRMDERYLMAAIPLAAASALFWRWMIPGVAAASTLYLVNVWSVLIILPYWEGRDMQQQPLVTLVSTASVLLLILFIAGLAVLMAPESRVVRFLRRSQPAGYAFAAVALIAVFVGGFATGRLFDTEPRRVGHAGGTVRISADQEWQDTGLRVSPGQKVTLEAWGEWTNDAGKVPKYGPAGTVNLDREAILPSAATGALLGRIGSGSTPFVVGAGTTIVADRTGVLELVMNDRPGDRNGDKGTMAVTITPAEP